MNIQQTQDLLNRATGQLARANEELNRPMEDVMVYSICHGVRQSTAELFCYFLLINDIDPGKTDSLEGLRELCSSVDSTFDTLDLSLMDCAGLSASGDAPFCLEIKKVRNCLDIANQIQRKVLLAK